MSDGGGRIRVVRFTPLGSGVIAGVTHFLLILLLWQSPKLATSLVAGSVYGLLVWQSKKKDE